MVIRFKKGKHRWQQKPDTVTCIRDDGSVTWARLHDGFVYHDFAHYVVETTFGFEDAFFGLVSKGYDISSFSDPKADRSFEIPKEALDTEPIVALLQADMLERLGRSGASDGIFREHCGGLAVHITDAQLADMREQLLSLLERWDALLPGESMALRWER